MSGLDVDQRVAHDLHVLKTPRRLRSMKTRSMSATGSYPIGWEGSGQPQMLHTCSFYLSSPWDRFPPESGVVDHQRHFSAENAITDMLKRFTQEPVRLTGILCPPLTHRRLRRVFPKKLSSCKDSYFPHWWGSSHDRGDLKVGADAPTIPETSNENNALYNENGENAPPATINRGQFCRSAFFAPVPLGAAGGGVLLV